MENYSKLYIGLGTTLLLGYALFNRNKIKEFLSLNQDNQKIKQLANKIEQSYKYADDTLLTLSTIKCRQIKDQNLTIQARKVEHLSQKNNDPISAVTNPFMPPFQKGKLITQLPPHHRLLYNKYNILKNHLLLVPSQFQHQSSSLTFNDFTQISLVNETLKGCFCYNCGNNAGFSQPHKHIQIFPYPSLKFPIMQKIKNELEFDKNTKKIPFFKFVHSFRWVRQQTLNKKSQQYYESYCQMLAQLRQQLQLQKFDYNILGTSNYIIMIPRRQQKYADGIIINSLTFMGVQVVKTQQIFNNLIKNSPTQIFQKVTYPISSKNKSQ